MARPRFSLAWRKFVANEGSLKPLQGYLHPIASLDALDISSDAAWPRETLRHSVCFHSWDVNADAQPDLVASYDIVHMRDFGFVLGDDDSRNVLGNLIRFLSKSTFREDLLAPQMLLKRWFLMRRCTEPGGFLQ